MKDFWLSCGHHLTDRDARGRLLISHELLKVYLARPELMPPSDACAAELSLHARLLADPSQPVARDEIVLIADADARENWDVMMSFRDRLLLHDTVEDAYLDFMRQGVGQTPPMFLNQMVHLILRNILDGCDDPLMLRAAEMLFRRQRLTLHGGSLIAADDETIAGTRPTSPSPLISMLGIPETSGIDVLSDDNADIYWERSDAFDLALDLTAGRAGLARLGTVMTLWLRHMMGVDATIEPLVEMQDVSFDWYLGLDAVGTGIGDQLWQGIALDDKTRASVVGLYRLTLRDDPDGLGQPRPVYMIMAMTPDKVLQMKPQNLLVGLPARRLETIN